MVEEGGRGAADLPALPGVAGDHWIRPGAGEVHPRGAGGGEEGGQGAEARRVGAAQPG